MRRTEQEILAEALLHLEYLDRCVAMDLEQDVVVDAIALRLAAMIDALGRLPGDVLEVMFGDEWAAMRGLRNRIAHGYHALNTDVLRITVTEELPQVRALIEARLGT